MADDRAIIIKFYGEKHPNADSLWIGQFGGYRFVTNQKYDDSQLGVYVPEGLEIPTNILADWGFGGMLAGKESNRVKAIRLRGELSQGIFIPLGEKHTNLSWVEGEDVTDELGITKYIAPIPVSMSGKMHHGPSSSLWCKFDIEDIKRWPDILQEGENVIITEKLHGTFCAVGIVGGERVVTSKGFVGSGIVFDEDPKNLYWRAVSNANIFEKIEDLLVDYGVFRDIIFFGEVFGAGVQDLTYGAKTNEVFFRAFDMRIDENYVPVTLFKQWHKEYEIPVVPKLYEGPWSMDLLNTYTSGKSTLAEKQIREGIVIRPVQEKRDPNLGRVILKSISPDYLLRKNATEFN